MAHSIRVINEAYNYLLLFLSIFHPQLARIHRVQFTFITFSSVSSYLGFLVFVNVVRDLRKAHERARETGRASCSFLLLFHCSIDPFSVR